jgi:NADH-quinone oxidoreductase subunit H
MTNTQLFTLGNIAVMVVIMWIIPLSFIPFFIWLERKGSAVIQDRVGPDRTNILGFRMLGYIQNFADTLKLFLKESITPEKATGFYYFLAPFWSMTVALLPLLVIPLAAPITLFGQTIRFQAANFNVGVLYIIAVSSLGVFAVVLAGWASNNKFSLLGGLRATAQMVSYELSMALSLTGLLMVYQGVKVDRIVETQGQMLSFAGHTLPLPNWGVFLQPVGFLLFLVAGFAETNRNPFDLAEGENELVAGYHLEYSSVKFALFFMAEYVNMAVVAFVISTLFLGGYQVPFASTEFLNQNPRPTLSILGAAALLGGSLFGFFVYRRADLQKDQFAGMKKWEPYLISAAGAGLAFVGLSALGYALFNGSFLSWMPPLLTALLQVACLLTKVLFFCWLYVWVRWTLPRFRYDQLMGMGWKLMLPLALLNLLVTGVLVLIQK